MQNNQLESLNQTTDFSIEETFDHGKFQRQVQYLKDNKQLTPKKMAILNPRSKLNIIFDIDHTLVFALDKKMCPNLHKTPQGKEWGSRL